MKKIIKLTESELNRVIKKVVFEQAASIKMPDTAQFKPNVSSASNTSAPPATNTTQQQQTQPQYSDPNALRTDLKLGDGGANVTKIQQQLMKLGFPRPDGKFGPVTQKSVRDFQAWMKLPVTGIADAATQAAIATQSNAIIGWKPPITPAQIQTPAPPAANTRAAQSFDTGFHGMY